MESFALSILEDLVIYVGTVMKPDRWDFRYIGVFLLSLATLMFQVSYMRLLSIASWHHFVWMVFSIAFLGYAASGTLLSLYPRLREPGFDQSLTTYSALFSVSSLLCYVASNLIPFDPARLAWDRLQPLYITVFYILLAIPFLLSGLTIALAMEGSDSNIGKLYFSNLIGSALGSFLVLPLFGPLDGPGVMVLTSVIGGASALVFALNLRGRRVAILLVWVLVIMIMVPFAGELFSMKISPYKGMEAALRYPDSRLIDTKWNSFSRVDVVSSGMVRYAPGLSLKYEAQIPEQIGVFVDGDDLNAITRYDGSSSSLDFTGFLSSTLPYALVHEPSVLVIGAGGGLDVLKAIHHGSGEIVACEANPIIVELIKNEYDGFSGQIYNDDRIRVVVSDGRSFIQSSRSEFDIIELSMAHSAFSSSTGIYALSENYLYTVESFKEFVTHLSEDGYLSITRWLLPPPREDVRIVSLATSALDALGTSEPSEHIAMIRSWGTVTLLVKRSPLSVEEIETIKGFCKEMGFDIVYVPGVEPSELNIYNRFPEPIYYQLVDGMLRADDINEFYSGYLYDIGPTTDDRPFFFHFFKWNRIIETYKSLSMKWQALIEGGYIVPLTLIQVSILSILLILLPLQRYRGKEIEEGKGFLAYFFFLGLGYMFVELATIQKFILVLSHPIYSVSTVIFSLLLGSGIGSYLSARITPLSKHHRFVLLFVTCLILVYGSASHLLSYLLTLPTVTRVFVTFLIIAPLGVFMGMPFPLGMRVLTGSKKPLIPWAWAVNGCASVLGSILPIIVALFFGYSRVYLLAGLVYLASLLVVSVTK